MKYKGPIPVSTGSQLATHTNKIRQEVNINIIDKSNSNILTVKDL